MTNREIEEKLRRAVGRETPDVLERILSASGKEERTINMSDIRYQKKKKFAAGLWAAGAAAAVLLLAGGGLGWNYRYGVDSIIAIDVNPSVELKASRGERVLEARALNHDAADILDGMELRGVDLDVAVNALIGSMVKHGFIDEAKNSVLVSVESGSAQRGERLQNEVAASINETLARYEVSAAVLSQAVSGDDGLRELARSNEISLGRASLIRRLAAADPSLDENQLAGLTVNDLSLLLLAREPGAVDVAYGKVSDSGYIGEKKAEETARAKVPGGTLKKLEFDYEDGRPCYEAEMEKQGVEYEFDIDAVTGEIFSWKEERAEGSGTQPPAAFLDAGEARKLALAHAGVREADAAPVKVKLDKDAAPPVYEVEFTANGVEYDYEIDAVTGEIRKADREEGAPYSSAPSGSAFSEEAAKELALGRVPGAELTKWKLDQEDGRIVYEGELYKDGIGYEFEMDASTGAFLRWEEEQASHTAVGPSNPQSGFLGTGEARKLALAHAGVREADAAPVKVKLDKDAAPPVYEVEFTANGVEYDYEIDAVTGEIRKADREEDAPYSSAPSGSAFSEEAAKELALSRVAGAKLTEWERDEDGGRLIYEGKLRKGNTVYEFELDASSGSFLKWEEERDD